MCTLVDLITDLNIVLGKNRVGIIFEFVFLNSHKDSLFCYQQCQLPCWHDGGDTERETARTWHHR